MYSQAVVVMATLVTMVTSMALPGAKVDTDVHLFMPGVQPQKVSVRACAYVCMFQLGILTDFVTLSSEIFIGEK